MRNILFAGLLLGLATGAARAQNAPLTVTVSQFKNDNGRARYWLYRSAEGFPTDGTKALRVVEAPITHTTSRYVFENLPPGSYAVTVIHDENGNHRFDTTFMGLPKEAYGTTNGARGGLSGPPKFDKASFSHAQPGTSVAIKVE